MAYRWLHLNLKIINFYNPFQEISFTALILCSYLKIYPISFFQTGKAFIVS